MFYKLFYNRSFFFLISILVSYLSSLSILDSSSSFWLNDEGTFYKWASQNTLDFKNFFDDNPYNTHSIYTYIRYKFFTEIIQFHLIFFQDPFHIVLFHKVLIIFIFIFLFARHIIINYGFLQFILIYISLNYLNLFFLRESLICILGLSFLLLPQVMFSYYPAKQNKLILIFKRIIKNFSLIGIFFLRPQMVIYFLNKRHIYFVGLFLLFSALLYSIYEKGYLQNAILLQGDINLVSLKDKVYHIYDDYIDKLNFKQFIFNVLASINSLNPFTKVEHYVNNKLILNLILLLLSSLILIFFLFQLLVSELFEKSKIAHSKELLISLLLTFILYGVSGLQIDIRILVSVIAPFLIYFQPHLLNLKTIFLIVLVLILILPIKIMFL